MRIGFHILFSLLAAGALVLGLSLWSGRRLEHHRQDRLLEIAETTRAKLAVCLNDRLHMVRGLEAFVQSRESFTEKEFQQFAEALEGEHSGILSLQLAPQAVVTFITHAESNEAARGHDLLADAARAPMVQRAIDNKEYIIAGPLELVQGGTALVGRLPIFVHDETTEALPKERFWGFSTILIDLDLLLLESGISASEDSIRFALRGKDGLGSRGSQFYGEPNSFEHSEILVNVPIPNGSWQLAVVADPGWHAIPEGHHMIWAGGLLLSGLAGWLLFVLLRRPEGMRDAVAQASKALLESEEKLRSSQKMEAIGQLTGGLAHDFNNLLAVVLGNLELLAVAPNIERTSKASIDMAIHAVERGAGLTRSLLAFSRKQELHSTVCDLNALIGPISSMLAQTLGRAIRIQTNLSPNLGNVQIDKNQFETVVLNLAINARDAMPEGGTLFIETHEVVLTEKHQDLAPGTYACLSVVDDGNGMPSETLERAFEPFFTTKRAQGTGTGTGTGLGLSMIYGFVKQSGGHIELSSREGNGTRVKIFLPVSSGALSASTRPEPSVNDSMELQAVQLDSKPKTTILVAEDEPMVRRLVVEQLEALGYRVIETEDAEDACRAHSLQGRVDLLLTDILMPGKLSGFDLAAELSRRQPELPIVFMSGYDQGSGRAPELAGHMLRKPFRSAELEEAIRDSLNAR